MKCPLLLLAPLSTLLAQPEQRAIIPQVADGGGWKTRIILVDQSVSQPSRVLLNFFGQNGQPLAFSIIGAGLVSTLERTIPPGGSLVLETPGVQPSVQAGWLEVRSGLDDGDGGGGYTPPTAAPMRMASPPTAATSPVSAFVTFRQSVPGKPDFEASVFSVPADTRAIAFAMDNLENYVTSIAVANPDANATDVTVTFRGATGAVIHREQLNLPPRGHAFFETTNRFQASRNQRGTVAFVTSSGRLAALCLWFNPTGPFTSIPSLTLLQ